MRPLCSIAALAVAFAATAAVPDPGQGADSATAITPEQILAGSVLYETHCTPCHGQHMVDPGGGFFDLRTFPPDRKRRFVNSVTNGKNSMPPWRSVLSPADIDNLWAYVIAGESTR